MQKYNKAIVAVVAGVVAVANAYWGDNSQVVTAIIAVATILGVYQVPNKG